MKKVIIVVCLALTLTGCTAYDASKKGVTDSYAGMRAIAGDVFGVAGKILEGGSVTFGFKGDAAHNDVEE